ncbi:hypothetical protein [Kitasatospora sp. NPDC087314]|uniref:hypothetical protein n=1 Tax=Kitasatospora sp. NPDC087314 TaxID=3364068 RepID=UPI0037FD8C9C
MKVADGILPDPAVFGVQLDEAEAMIADYADADSEEADAAPTGIRLTPLDPRRPARDLLEDLRSGIHDCWPVHDEYAELDDEDEEPEFEDDSEDEAAGRHQHHSRARFGALVRAVGRTEAGPARVAPSGPRSTRRTCSARAHPCPVQPRTSITARSATGR